MEAQVSNSIEQIFKVQKNVIFREGLFKKAWELGRNKHPE